MMLNIAIAGFVLFFINSCRTPLHFVGYQFRHLSTQNRAEFAKQLAELSSNEYKHFEEQGCSYYMNKKSMHYITICQNQSIYFVGTDVRHEDLSKESAEDILAKIDQDSSVRVSHVKNMLVGQGSTNISGATFTVYKSHELSEF